ncbi:MAG: ArsR family transcriptional regulator [Flavobacteriaceae bacterium]|nr:ArsR family transcriptional regulator [Flavobacteriaceae bacterium]|tara:strand:+ start:23515 stop:23802 length:288 start_codon:yes stop_codon:yes gene_type:complete
MNKDLDKLLFNPIRLKIISFLFSVENTNFKKLIEVSGASKGNLSIQLKKLSGAGYIKIKKSFENNYPLTKCRITFNGRKAFENFFKNLESLKQHK